MRLSFVLAAFVALALGFGAGMAQPAAAQSVPASFYGKVGVSVGDRVEAFIGGRSCGATTVNAVGEWALSVAASAPCAPTEGAAITFTVNGQAATATPAAIWRVGGVPADVAGGYRLEVVAGIASAGASGAGGTAAGGGVRVSGSIPLAGGFGLVVFTSGGTIQQLAAAIGCPQASMALYATTPEGNFITYVPGTTIAAVNAAFLAVFPGGNIAANTPFIGRCQ